MLAAQKANKSSDELAAEIEKVKVDHVPVDFDAYSITDLNLHVADEKAPIKKDERIWRISSLTASVDDDTKILVLPLPESKR